MIDLHNALIAGRMLGGSGGSPAPEPTLITKSITANGTYNAASDNADGYSSVTVAIPETVPIQKYNAAQGGWDGGVGSQVWRYRSAQENPDYYGLRCAIDHFVFFDNDSNKIISTENSNLLVAVGILTESTYGSYKYYYKEYDSGWRSLPYTVSGQTITPDKPITITFRKSDNSEITPSDVGVVTIT